MSTRWVPTLVLGLFVACGEKTRTPIDASVEARTCPTHLDMELIGSESRFSPGSSGTAHGVGLAEGSRVTVEILSCDDECRRCTFHGPVRGDPAIEPVVTQRCLNGLATTCTTDDECETAASGSGPCRYIFPPISARIIVASCTLVYFDPILAEDPSPMQGTVDLLTGEADLPVFNLAISVSLQVVPGAPDGGCVECFGDTVPFDGEKGGTCQFGGQVCDVSGIGTAVASTTSYDCAPPPNAFININLPANGTSTASRMWTMDGTRPSCTNAGVATGEPCWCGICSDGTPCIADSECATGSCGAAGSTVDPINVKNNGCGNDVCNWDPIARSGICSVSGTSCFPDGVIGESMVAEGAAEMNQGFFIAQLANLVCMPELDGVSTGFGTDAIAGFPGPMLFEARFKVKPRGEQP